MANVTVVSDPIEPPTIDRPSAEVQQREIFRRFEEAEASIQRDRSTIDLTKAAAAAAPEIPPEQLDSVIVQTPAGEVEFGPPSGVSMTLRIAQMLGDSNGNRLYLAALRTLMCVRKIDGKPVTPVTSEVEAQYLANLLGDSTVDYLFTVYVENWPPPGKGELQVLRKNKRVT